MKNQLSYAFIALAAFLCGCSKENIQDESFAAESSSKQETGDDGTVLHNYRMSSRSRISRMRN